jgi:hypothetical protein
MPSYLIQRTIQRESADPGIRFGPTTSPGESIYHPIDATGMTLCGYLAHPGDVVAGFAAKPASIHRACQAEQARREAAGEAGPAGA